MSTTIQVTCSNGVLIPDRHLSSELEGKNLQIIILEPERFETEEKSAVLSTIENFLGSIAQYAFKLPADYKFKRDKLYDR